jgi:3-hydroxyisobutyrate dehydrogenase-like beta-hydroxyacid dehydrogenase
VPGGDLHRRPPGIGRSGRSAARAQDRLLSGPKSAFDEAREALSAYSRAQIWVGEAEEARYAKLAVNLMVAVTAGMMGEALALAQKGGIGWEAMLELLGESVVASPLVKYKLDPLRRRDYTPMATGALVLKDIDLMVEAARQAGLELPLARHMQAAYRRMTRAQLADEDFFSIVKVLERE